MARIGTRTNKSGSMGPWSATGCVDGLRWLCCLFLTVRVKPQQKEATARHPAQRARATNTEAEGWETITRPALEKGPQRQKRGKRLPRTRGSCTNNKCEARNQHRFWRWDGTERYEYDTQEDLEYFEFCQSRQFTHRPKRNAADRGGPSGHSFISWPPAPMTGGGPFPSSQAPVRLGSSTHTCG